MGIIAWIILGLVAGMVAKALVPGRDPQGLLVTTLIGVAGALLGGFLATRLFDIDGVQGFFNPYVASTCTPWAQAGTGVMTADQTSVPAGSPRENTGERADRNFVEILHGVRVAVTGVQMLFAFLLIVPFSPGFAEVARTDRGLYYLALIYAATASVLFIAPVAQHVSAIQLGHPWKAGRTAGGRGPGLPQRWSRVGPPWPDRAAAHPGQPLGHGSRAADDGRHMIGVLARAPRDRPWVEGNRFGERSLDRSWARCDAGGRHAHRQHSWASTVNWLNSGA